MAGTIAVYATDTMADWEYAYLTTGVVSAEQARPGRFELRFVGDGMCQVRSLAGMPVPPDLDLDDLAGLDDLRALVIPGGDTYAEGHERLLATVAGLVHAGTHVAAICGATYLLARGGFLDERDHTSNAREFLASSGYAGIERYQDAPVVTDQRVTTGSGVRPVAFTAEVFRVTGLFPPSVVDPWERLNHSADPGAYFELMEAMGAFAES